VSPSDHKRTNRVAELLRHELSRLLTEGVRDPRVGFVTVTEVRPTDDLKSAKVYVSVYGTDEQRAATLEGLKASAGFLRHELSHRLDLRFTPFLSFCFDDTLDRAERMDAVFSAIAHGETDTPPLVHQPAIPVDTARTDLAEQARHFEQQSAPTAKPAPRHRLRRPRRDRD
jgi:ribosome-binding factor A